VYPAFAPHPAYTGAPAFAPPFHAPMTGHHPHHGHGFCHSCCHPHSQCQCHRRECRKESKELLVNSDDAATKPVVVAESPASGALNRLRSEYVSIGHEIGTIDRVGRSEGFIGGGCCVHLSVEYIANDPTQPSRVIVAVLDSENTTLRWGREEPAGTPYRIKEGIITTKPGAHLMVSVVNATARVRWCEIFSC
jgi:hypothetical protein